MSEKRASMRVSDAVEGGGLLHDVDVKITSSKAVLFAYRNSPVEAPGVLVTMESLEDGSEHEEFFSIGAREAWAPTKDGKGFRPLGEKQFPTKSCKAMLFLSSLVNCGFDEDLMEDGDWSVLEGVGFHGVRVPLKTTGLPGRDDGRQRDVLTAAAILFSDAKEEKTWRKDKGSGGSSGGGKKAKEAEEDNDEEFDAECAELLAEILQANDGEVKVSDLPNLIYKHAPKGADKQPLVKRITSTSFLSSYETWELNKGVLTLMDTGEEEGVGEDGEDTEEEEDESPSKKTRGRARK